MELEPIIKVDKLVKTYDGNNVVDGVSFEVKKGEIFGILGPNGAGKTTTLEMLEALRPIDGGVATIDGIDVAKKPKDIKNIIGIQLQSTAFYDKLTLREQLKMFGSLYGRTVDTEALLAKVQLTEKAKNYVEQLSGGQKQRVGIARALAVNPKLVVLDEPVSALDVSVQAGVINLLEELRASLGLSYLMVAHDLAVIRHASDRVAVMYLGRIVEIGHVDQVFDNPIHPYTKALLSAIPVPDPEVEAKRERTMLEGDLPTPVNAPVGCGFSSRCPVFKLLPEDKQKVCLEKLPELEPVEGQDHAYACYFPEGVSQVSPENVAQAA